VVARQEVVKEAPLVVLHATEGGGVMVVGANGHHARLVGAPVALADVSGDAEDGEALPLLNVASSEASNDVTLTMRADVRRLNQLHKITKWGERYKHLSDQLDRQQTTRWKEAEVVATSPAPYNTWEYNHPSHRQVTPAPTHPSKAPGTRVTRIARWESKAGQPVIILFSRFAFPLVEYI